MNGALSGLVTGSLAKVLASLCVTYGPRHARPRTEHEGRSDPTPESGPRRMGRGEPVSEKDDLGHEPEETGIEGSRR